MVALRQDSFLVKCMVLPSTVVQDTIAPSAPSAVLRVDTNQTHGGTSLIGWVVPT